MTPQQKKAQSLKHDCRNTYGENSKSSRKAIHVRKRWVNRSFRRAVNQAIQDDDPEATDSAVSNVARKSWKKASDTPVGELLLSERTVKMEHRIRDGHAQDSEFLDRLEKHLHAATRSPSEFRVIMRRCRAVSLATWGSSLDLNSSQLDIIEKFLENDQ